MKFDIERVHPKDLEGLYKGQPKKEESKSSDGILKPDLNFIMSHSLESLRAQNRNRDRNW